jgi:hypothetical protein
MTTAHGYPFAFGVVVASCRSPDTHDRPAPAATARTTARHQAPFGRAP